jgi:hypothetical protein
MKAGDLVKFKDRAITAYPSGVAIVISVDTRVGRMKMCRLLGPFTGSMPANYRLNLFEVIDEGG